MATQSSPTSDWGWLAGRGIRLDSLDTDKPPHQPQPPADPPAPEGPELPADAPTDKPPHSAEEGGWR